MNDLLKLAESVEAGEFPSSLGVALNIHPSKAIILGWQRNGFFPTQSIDSAVALLEEVLPGWGWHVRKDNDGCYASCLYPEHNMVTPGGAETASPAAALVAAILKAKASEKGELK